MFHEVISNAFKIFIILDPVGMFPIIMARVKKLSFKERSKLIRLSLLTAFAIACAVLIIGDYILNVLLLKMYDIKIAGGILLIVIGHDMLSIKNKNIPPNNAKASKYNPIFPIAIPFICGPGVITTIMIIKHESSSITSAYLSVSIGIFISSLIIYLLNKFSKFINSTTMIVVQPISALIIAMFGIHILLSGMSTILSSL